MSIPKPRVLAALDTPLTPDGDQVAVSQVAPLVDFLLTRGVCGLFVAGSTGLGPLLADDKWEQISGAAIEAARRRVDVLVNVSAPSTKETLRRLDWAFSHHATAVVAATPVAYRYEKRAVLAFFADVLQAAGRSPVYLYRKAGDPWGAPEVAVLAEQYPNLAGIKDSATDMAEHLRLIALEGLSIYQGYEALFASSSLAGGAGCVSGLATVLPEPVVEVAKLIETGGPALWQAQNRLTTVRQLVCGTNPYAAFKALLSVRGVDVGAPRRPFIAFTKAETEDLLRALQPFGLNLAAESPEEASA